MPYTHPDTREATRPCAERPADTAGELGFQINELIVAYLRHRIAAGAKPGFTLLSTPLGVLDSIAREYYRRVMQPFENQKIAENGDVFQELLAEALPHPIHPVTL